jgi:C-terminal processing protease CtpA/Prc
MVTDVLKQISRLAVVANGAVLTLALTGVTWGQQPPTSSSSSSQEAREKAKEKIDAAKESKQGARETTRDAREGARTTAREDRQTTRDTRAEGRDTVRDDRQTIREARRDVRAARREFIASRIRSGDLGLWFRRATDRLMVSDIAGRGAIAQTGLKEGDEIVSVNGQPVHTEREFVDKLFAEHASNQPASVVINRNGQQQTLTIQPKQFVDEHLAGDDSLREAGLIIDESQPDHVKVQAVIPRSPAFYAGVRSGDQITGFRGQRVAAVADFVRAIASAASGTAPLEVNRNNQTRQLEIEIPDENQGAESRTALRPTLPNPGTTAPQAGQPGTTPRPVPPTTQPRLNPPR